MAFNETVHQLHSLLEQVAADLNKVHRGNKSAAQRVRVGTIHLTKIGKQFRQESVAAEKGGRFRKKPKKKKMKSRKALAR